MECGTGTFAVTVIFACFIIALILALHGVIRLLMGKPLWWIHIAAYILIGCLILGALT